MDPDRLAQLEQERRFLLGSLNDLDEEHRVGDIDDHDHSVLGDGYTARAAAVLRELADGTAALGPRRRTKPAVLVAWVLGVVAVAVLSGWLVARSSGQRLAGQTMTGGQAIDDVAANLAEARSLMGTGEYATALERFRTVTDLEPDNAEARTYTSWLLVITSRSIEESALRAEVLTAAMAGFERVIGDDPAYADPYCLSAVAAARFLEVPDPDLAKSRARQCLDNNPPSDMRALIAQFLDGTAG